MATVAQNKDQQSTMNVLAPAGQQAPAQQTETPIAPQLGTPSAIGGTITQQQSNQQPQQNQSGLFTGLNKFFSANQQAGQKIGQSIQGKAQTEASGIGQAVQEKLGTYKTNIGQAQQNIGQAQQAGLGAVQAAQQGQLTPEQIKQYQAAAKGQTLEGKGLGDVAGFDISTEQQRQNALQQQANQAQTAQGTFGLLQDFFKTPQKQYTAGQQALDTAFFRKDPNAIKQTQQTYQDVTQQVGSKVQQSQAEADAQAKALAEATQNLQQKLASQKTSAEESLQAKLQQQAQELAQQRNTLQNQINSAIQSGDINSLPDDVKQKLGIPTNIYNVNATDAENIYDRIMSDKYVSPEEYQQFQDWAKQQAFYKGGAPGYKNVTMPTGPSSGYKFNLGDYFTGNVAQYSPQQLQDLMATQQQLTEAQQLAALGNQQQSLITNESLVGQGLSGALAGVSFNKTAAQDRANALMDQYFKEEINPLSVYHPNVQQLADTWKAQQIAKNADPYWTNYWYNNFPAMMANNAFYDAAGVEQSTKQNMARREVIQNLYNQLTGNSRAGAPYFFSYS